MAKITLFVQAIGKTPKKTSKKSNSDVYVDLESAGIRKRKVNTTSPVETIRGAPAITSAGRPTMTAKVKLHIFSLPPKVNANRFKTFSSYRKVFLLFPTAFTGQLDATSLMHLHHRAASSTPHFSLISVKNIV